MRAPRQLERLAAQGLALGRATRAASRAHRAGPLAVARRAHRLRRRQGFEYDEALRLGLLDPAMPEATCAGFVSRHVNMAAQRRLNHSDMPPLVGHKLVFQRRCEAIGLPVPALYGVVDREGPLGRADAFAAFLAQDLPDEFVIKPAWGYEGFGVRLLRREGGRLLGADGRSTTAAALHAELRADAEFDTFLVQERLRNHPDIAALGDETTLHTARLVTLIGRDGGARILWACLRIGRPGAAVDNFRSGALGNAIIEVDPEDGTMGPAMVARADGCGFLTTPTLPGSGRRIEGVRLVGWPAARELALAASLRFLPLRTLGWDVALTPGGPVLVEANTRWGVLPTAGMRAVVAQVEAEA